VSPQSPTFGAAGGEHRVLEPAGGVPLTATRLDALAELWDGELRLDLEAIVLTREGHAAWTARLSDDPQHLRAAFAETVAERGGCGPEAADAVLVGRVAAVGHAHPHPVEVGERVAVLAPAGAVPLFAAPSEVWDGGRVVELAGHAIVPAAVATVPIGDVPAALAAVLAEVADVPVVLAGGQRTVVLGLDHPGGAVALAAAVTQHRHVTVVVRSLGMARLARAAGASATVIVDLADPTEAAVRIAETVGEGPRERADLVVVADPAAGALAARLAPVVQVLAHPQHVGRLTHTVLQHAAAAGRGLALHVGRGPVVDRGAALRELVASHHVLQLVLRWQAGVGSLPTLGPDDRIER
jgi:hypothetical protein